MTKYQQVKVHRKHRVAWKWEIAASAGSLAFLAGMIIVLAVNDGREIFSWHGVTLNAVVSVLSTTSKALLLFTLGESIGQWKWVAFSKGSRPLIDLERVDSASRGPLGGAQWLWISNWQHRSLLQLGAFVTILALAVDPFSQQLVQNEQKLKDSAIGSTTIVRAQRFSKGTTLVPTVVPIIMTAMADYTIQAGIFNALIQPYDALVQQTPFLCPTGNCTWAPFESLAICSTCHNLASQLSSYTEPTYLYDEIYLYDQLHKRELQKRQAWTNLVKNATSFELPNGLYINNLNGAPYYLPDASEHYFNVGNQPPQRIFMTSFGTGNASRTNAFRDSDNLLWAMSFLRMRAPPEDSTHSGGWPNVSVEAVECGLFYCVNQYTSSVRNGTLYETEAPVQNATREPDSWELIRLPATLEDIHLYPESMDSLEFNNSTSSLRRTDLMFGDGFNLSWAAVNTLSSQFQSQFASQTVFNMSKHKNYSQAHSLDYSPVNGFYKSQRNTRDPDLVLFSPNAMQILYDSPDITDMFRRVARSLSNAIRAGADNDTMHVGVSGVMTMYYRIQWPWIALHIVVAVGGISFLFATINESRRAGVPIWKSSALATLSHANEIGDVLIGVETIEEMEAKASQHFVRLFESRSERKEDQEGFKLTTIVASRSLAGSDDSVPDEEDRTFVRS